jgi:hypothetical protein
MKWLAYDPGAPPDPIRKYWVGDINESDRDHVQELVSLTNAQAPRNVNQYGSTDAVWGILWKHRRLYLCQVFDGGQDRFGRPHRLVHCFLALTADELKAFGVEVMHLPKWASLRKEARTLPFPKEKLGCDPGCAAATGQSLAVNGQAHPAILGGIEAILRDELNEYVAISIDALGVRDSRVICNKAAIRPAALAEALSVPHGSDGLSRMHPGRKTYRGEGPAPVKGRRMDYGPANLRGVLRCFFLILLLVAATFSLGYLWKGKEAYVPRGVGESGTQPQPATRQGSP